MATLKARFKSMENMGGAVDSITANTVYLLEATGALDAWGYVLYNAVHPELSGYKCKQKQVALAPESSGNLWILTSTYENTASPRPGSGPGPNTEPPPEPPTTDTWSRNVDVQSVAYTAEAEYDFTGVAIKNSVGIWFTPGIVRTTYDTVATTFSWSQFAFPTAIFGKIGTVQDTGTTKTFCGNAFSFTDKRALLRDCKISSVRQDGKNFWTVSAVVETQPTDYDPITIPDVGMTDINGKPFLTDGGFPVQIPVRLYQGEPSTSGSGTMQFTMHGTSNFIYDIPGDPI